MPGVSRALCQTCAEPERRMMPAQPRSKPPRTYSKHGLTTLKLSHLKPVREHFGDWRALDINFRSIEAYITTRREDGKANATINRELELLGRALRLAHDRQLLPSLPKVRVLPEDNTRQGFFERSDLEAVVAGLPDYLRDFTRFAYLAGWRKAEIASLK
jgi:hypothetical protein